MGRTVSSTENAIADRPVVTQGGHNINVEAVLELRPTLFIVDHSIGPRDAIDQIRAAGVTTVVMEPKRTIDSVDEDIKTWPRSWVCQTTAKRWPTAPSKKSKR